MKATIPNPLQNANPSTTFPAVSNTTLAASSLRTLPPILPSAGSLPPPPFLSATHTTPLTSQALPDDYLRQHRHLLLDSFHHNTVLRILIRKLSRSASDPVSFLRKDGDWSPDILWTALSFLTDAGRGQQALQVFDFWRKKESNRNCERNYSRFIELLCEKNLLVEVSSVFQHMEENGHKPSLGTYNAIIHGFARVKRFNDAHATMDKMIQSGVIPKIETYNGLIQAYGSHRMYHDMNKCARSMGSFGCFPDEVTYNILIAEFARGGLLVRMDEMYRALLSKQMKLWISTLVVMLEAYTDLEIFSKMEKVYKRIFKSRGFVEDRLLRKIATVYINNRMFSRLEELANNISDRRGRSDLVWCILLLSSACSMSRRGLQSVVREIESGNVDYSLTFLNITALFHLKARDFGTLHKILSQIGCGGKRPDIMSFAILFDACKDGYDGTHILNVWNRKGFLQNEVQLETDDLVLVAFGDEYFIKLFLNLYLFHKSHDKDAQLWQYGDLINLAFSGSRLTRKPGGQLE